MTTMIHLITLVVVVLPGLASSFGHGEDIGVCCNMNKRSEDEKDSVPVPSDAVSWRDLYEQTRTAAFPSPPTLFGNYVCCNHPPTPPSHPRFFPRNRLRSLALSLAKRDDRYAALRWLYARAAREEGMGSGSEGQTRTAGEDDFTSKRDPVMLRMLSAAGRGPQMVSGLREAVDPSQLFPMDYPAAPAFKRGSFGSMGGPNDIRQGR